MIGQAFWNSTTTCPELGADEVHVWSASLDISTDKLRELRGLLSPEELARADRFLQPQHRVQAAAARGWLRSLLGRYLKTAPQSIEFGLNEHGKPSLAAPHADSRVRFNISHSHGHALFAFVRGRELGVDIERIRKDRPFANIARRFFAPGEVAQLQAFPMAQQPQAFYECWTRKEAYIKAVGKGLSLPLDSFRVEFGPGQLPSILEARGEADAPSRWTLFDLKPFPDFAGALAVEQPMRIVRCWMLEYLI